MQLGRAAATLTLGLIGVIGSFYVLAPAGESRSAPISIADSPAAPAASGTAFLQADPAQQWRDWLDALLQHIEQLRTTIGPSLREQVQEMAESLREAQAEQVPLAEPSRPTVPAPEAQNPAAPPAMPPEPLDSSQPPGCTTERESGDNWARTSVHCFQQQVTTSGSSSSSVTTSSSSVSVSSSSSTQAR
jgi:hypothetical protein